jgi:hypothetical protein
MSYKLTTYTVALHKSTPAFPEILLLKMFEKPTVPTNGKARFIKKIREKGSFLSSHYRLRWQKILSLPNNFKKVNDCSTQLFCCYGKTSEQISLKWRCFWPTLPVNAHLVPSLRSCVKAEHHGKE